MNVYLVSDFGAYQYPYWIVSSFILGGARIYVQVCLSSIWIFKRAVRICGSLLCQIGDLEFKCDRWEARASSNTFLLFVHKLLLLGATYFTGFVRSFFRGCFELLSWWSGFGFFSTHLTGTWNHFRMVEVIFARQILRCRRLLFERLFN